MSLSRQFHYLKLLLLCLFHCKDTAESIHSMNVPKSRNRFSEINYEHFGILHTLQDYALWANKEESIAKVLTEKLELLETEQKLIIGYLGNKEMPETSRNPVLNWTDTPEEENLLNLWADLDRQTFYRTAILISQLQDLLSSSNYLRNEKNVRKTLELENLNGKVNSRRSVGWEDYYMSMTTFIHNEEVYGFEPRDMVEGIQLDTSSGGTLSASQCLEIGMFALFRHTYNCAVEWLELSLKKYIEDINNVDQNDKLISDLASALLLVAIQEHNRAKLTFQNDEDEKKMGYYDKYFSFYLYPIIKEEAPDERIRFREKLYQDYKGLGKNTNPEAQFMDLCSGNIAQTAAMQITLKCRYGHHHPYLLINPVKVEHLSESPPILQFYDMISNKTIEKIKAIYRPQVTLSTVFGSTDLNSLTTLRTSAGMGMHKYSIPRGAYKLAEYASGLNIWGSSEPTQFAEYTYGRYYAFHKDLIEDEEGHKTSDVSSNDDRLATLLYYLEIPEMGGYTPFCQAGIHARPVRGSAVLWYNLHQNGTPRNDVEHGACPVIYGHKIIMNHWIRYDGNWNKFKCTRNSLE